MAAPEATNHKPPEADQTCQRPIHNTIRFPFFNFMLFFKKRHNGFGECDPLPCGSSWLSTSVKANAGRNTPLHSMPASPVTSHDGRNFPKEFMSNVATSASSISEMIGDQTQRFAPGETRVDRLPFEML